MEGDLTKRAAEIQADIDRDLLHAVENAKTLLSERGQPASSEPAFDYVLGRLAILGSQHE